MSAEAVARVLGGESQSGGWWSCHCPAHDDRTPSLSLRDGDCGIIVKCWAGCDFRDVLAELRRRGLIEGRASGRRASSSGSRHKVPKREVKDRSLEIRQILEGCPSATR